LNFYGRQLLDAKNAVRANYNLPPLVSESAPMPAKIVMHPTAADAEAARRHRERLV
jgi:hypothetical protein